MAASYASMPTDPAIAVQGFILGFSIAASVGPIALLVIRRTLAEGRTVGLVSGMGVATADGTYGAIAAFGLTAVTDLLVDWRRALALIGGTFLLWVAWRTFSAVPPTDPDELETPARGLPGAYLSTLALTLTNPMTILSFAALFIGLGVAGEDAASATVLTAGVFAGSACWWVVLTAVIARFRSRVTPRALRWVNIGSGLIIGAFAVLAIGAAILAG